MEKNGHNENTYHVNIKPQTTHTTRWVVFVFLIIGLVTFGYGFSSIGGGISSLDESDDSKSFWSKIFSTENENNNQIQVDNQDKTEIDTDGDGLSDIEEQNIYGTSPYLADTDSDGDSDKAEIDAGENPICAKGQDCSIASVPPNTDITTDDSSVEQILTQDEGLDLDDPEKLRQQLIEAGMSKEDLDQVSDEDLIAIAKDAAKEAESEVQQSVGDDVSYTGVTTTTQEAQKDVKDITADELRQALLDQGMDKLALDQFTDEELLSQFQQIASEENN